MDEGWFKNVNKLTNLKCEKVGRFDEWVSYFTIIELEVWEVILLE
jgi:hypothetical protein